MKPLEEQTTRFMKLLFDPEDNFTYGSFYSTQPTNYCDYTLKGKTYTHYDSKGRPSLPTTEFLAMNPIKKDHTRSLAGVSKHRTFLFESDSIPLEYQSKIFAYSKKYHKFPISTLVYSGNKSKHALIVLETPIESNASYLSIPDTSYDHRTALAIIYTTIHRMIRAKLNNIVDEMRNLPSDTKNHLPVKQKENYFDANVQDCSRLTRFPNGLNTKNKKRLQRVEHIGKRIPYEEFIEFLKTCPFLEHKVQSEPRVRDPLLSTLTQIDSLEEFKVLYSNDLRDFIESFKINSRQEGMYGRIKAFLFSVKDEFPDVDENLLYQIYLGTIYPHLKMAGYKSLDKIHPCKNTIFRIVALGNS